MDPAAKIEKQEMAQANMHALAGFGFGLFIGTVFGAALCWFALHVR
jgi:hypothetical protein